jgi:glycosyl hydrolase family 26
MRLRVPLALATAALLAATLGGASAADGDAAAPAANGAARPAAGAAPSAAARCGTVSDTLVPACGAWLGMWPRTDASGAKGGDLRGNLAGLESRAGRRFDIVSRYYGWGDRLPDATDAAWREEGRMVLLDLRARDFRSGAQIRWADIAQGRHDAYLQQVAADLEAFGAKVFFSFNQEPEAELEKGTAFAGTPQEYAAAYRHIHELFDRAGATNVVWVWWVMGFMGHIDWYPALYPGDGYVDWVSYDPYDFNACRNAAPETPRQTIAPFLDWLTTSGTGAGKPVMLSEFGSHGADRGDWYRGVGELVKQTPRIKAIIPFNTEPPAGTCDFRLTSSPAKWEGFAAVAKDPFFNQNPPNR